MFYFYDKLILDDLVIQNLVIIFDEEKDPLLLSLRKIFKQIKIHPRKRYMASAVCLVPGKVISA